MNMYNLLIDLLIIINKLFISLDWLIISNLSVSKFTSWFSCKPLTKRQQLRESLIFKPKINHVQKCVNSSKNYGKFKKKKHKNFQVSQKIKDRQFHSCTYKFLQGC